MVPGLPNYAVSDDDVRRRRCRHRRRNWQFAVNPAVAATAQCRAIVSAQRRALVLGNPRIIFRQMRLFAYVTFYDIILKVYWPDAARLRATYFRKISWKNSRNNFILHYYSRGYICNDNSDFLINFAQLISSDTSTLLSSLINSRGKPVSLYILYSTTRVNKERNEKCVLNVNLAARASNAALENLILAIKS